MRIIDRMKQYLEARNITPRHFERTCRLSNGYLQKQVKGRGAISSEILQKIHDAYADLSLVWLLTGRGSMTLQYSSQQVQEETVEYAGAKDELIRLLRDQVAVLQAANADKDRIITLMAGQRSPA